MGVGTYLSLISVEGDVGGVGVLVGTYSRLGVH